MSSSSSSGSGSGSGSGLTRYSGKVKQIDKDGSGFIITYDRNRDVQANPTSFSDPNLIQIGDRVEFSLTAIDVTPSGPHCYCCDRLGHYASRCTRKKTPWAHCYQCGARGHFARDCFHPDNRRKWAVVDRDDHDHDHDKKGIVGSAVISVKNRRDVKKVEAFEDCFILDFNPTQIRDDDGDNDDDDDDDDECRSMVCVKKMEDMNKVEATEDCFILDFDPTQPIKFSNLCLSDKSQTLYVDEDVTIIAENGKVACRDYPHSRHLCAKHSFKTTPHDLHCKLCYCYICDIPAPCEQWVKITGIQHCDATPDLPFCRLLRDQKTKEKG